MTDQIYDLLASHALGLTNKEEASEADNLLTNPAWRALHDEFSSASTALSEALEPAELPTELRERLLRNTQTANRFSDFVGQVATLLDYSADAADTLLRLIDEASSWVLGPSPGSSLVHFDPGPRLGNALTGFVKIAAGMPFPEHEHVGAETILVLQGSYEDSNGTIYRTGDSVVNADGSVHDFSALPGPDLIYLVILGTGIKIGGVLVEI
jgi:putative transcriptional regulator